MGNTSLYPEFLISASAGVMNFAEYLIQAFNIGDIIKSLKSVPAWLLLGGYLFLRSLFGALMMFVLKPDMEQGAMTLVNTPMKVIKYGIMIYLSVDVFLFLLLISVIGAPFAVAVFLATRLLLLFGYVPLSIFVGYALEDVLKIKGYTSLYYFLGAFVCFLCCFVPILGRAFLFFVFPVLSYGSLYVLMVNKYKIKHSHKVVFHSSASHRSFKKKKILSIIVKDVDFTDLEEKNEN
ncbi:hypothetical protein SDC9_158694 [bioreactor metagenome]|uniref:Uncharacterized protein n=1 Tax=bioreactor metagenome TaxID=1076179 RepID=A0A645FG98_9ZZZZ